MARKDLSTTLTSNCELEIITNKSPEGIEILRHDAAHVLAQAVKEIYPETQVTIGPVIENGFYYDFARKKPFTDDDLKRFEKRMHEIVARDLPITREVWDRKKAIDFFQDQGEAYKAEIINELPETEEVSLYRQGDFIDLCRGYHLPSTKKLGKAFKLLRVSGAYWRGDSKNEMLQRIYGTAWHNEKDLKAYLTMQEEAEKRDHRKIGKEIGLFHFQEEAPGSVFWHPKGWTVYQLLMEYMRKQQNDNGYVEINTPDMMDRSLWETSGHWQKFGENMFSTKAGNEDKDFALKPMNCPGGCSCLQTRH